MDLQGAPTYYDPQVPAEPIYPIQNYSEYYPPEPEPALILADDDLKKALIVQVEYYFSDANLAKGTLP